MASLSSSSSVPIFSLRTLGNFCRRSTVLCRRLGETFWPPKKASRCGRCYALLMLQVDCWGSLVFWMQQVLSLHS
ncbi:hypothetical protein FNV43_RR06508 [Rhamnella rubrinervis]|uniref:Uncharacterized protein n=1 Tax=Rhamnella rubrinervis TaxID=2594499 RepID=A0A8K0MLI5_9ROSA|nr:hypothetical protein FNV43_RR06508 [Rhamnella rubrinervis]